MTLSITRLTPTIGALLEGIELGEALQDDARAQIDSALVEHQVLFFRDQSLTPAQHRDFAARFGRLHIHPIYPAHPEVPEVMVLDTDLIDVRDNAIWHTDVTFTETPPMGSILIARVLPQIGGDTLWSSSIAAYDALSPPMQRFLQGLSATHDITQSFPAERFATSEAARSRLEKA